MQSKSSVVLVHGELLNGSSWNKVIPLLQKNGLWSDHVPIAECWRRGSLTETRDHICRTKLDAEESFRALAEHPSLRSRARDRPAIDLVQILERTPCSIGAFLIRCGQWASSRQVRQQCLTAGCDDCHCQAFRDLRKSTRLLWSPVSAVKTTVAHAGSDMPQPDKVAKVSDSTGLRKP